MRKGFSLLEVLVAAALFAFIAVLAAKAFTQMQSKGSAAEAATQAKAELTELRRRIQRSFQERLFPRAGDPNPPFTTPPTAGVPGCGDLMIARRVTPPGGVETIEWIGYHTECNGNCIRVRRYAANGATQLGLLDSYPKLPTLRTASVCFSAVGGPPATQIAFRVNGQLAGNGTFPISLPGAMPVSEASKGVEFLPN